MTVRILIGLALVGACAKRAPDPTPEPTPAPKVQTQDEISLAFGWSVPSTMVVEATERVERAGRTPESLVSAAEVTYTLRADGEGLVFEPGSLREPSVVADGQALDLESSRHHEALALLFPPALRLSSKGSFTGLKDPGAQVAAYKSALQAAFAGVEVPPPILDAADDELTKGLREVARVEWFGLVEGWPGRWTTQKSSRTNHRITGILDGQGGTLAAQQRIGGETPCGPGLEEGSCVTLILERVPDPRTQQGWVEHLKERHGRRGPVEISEATWSETTTVLAHAATLVPIRSERVRVERVVLSRPDAEPEVLRDRRTVRTLTFAPE
ncbi:MAG: hypothetical protein EA397_02925 [Deltaproteobacteria bacterium]|nr:MAG: hypothetical protein EA397_02925 [Deltaproteobacteria bacterium]